MISSLSEQEKIDLVREYEKSELGYRLFHRENKDRIGVSDRSFWEWTKKYKHLASLSQGQLHDGHHVKGTSTLYDTEGNIRLQWVKTDKDKQDLAAYLNSVALSLIEDIKPRNPVPLSPVRNYINELCNVFPIADYHMGLYCSEAETGTHWNLEKAENTIKDWFYTAVKNSPEASHAVLMNLGDMCHIDGNMPYTTSRKHALDTSGRFHEIKDAIVRSFDYMIKVSLQNYKTVHVIYCRGNHDDHVSDLIRDMIARAYENNPRVTFDKTQKRYHAYVWGDTSLFAHHGGKRNLKQQAETFVSMFSKEFGNTKYRYGFTGHRHHEERGKEHAINMRQFTTLAPLDNYAAELGYSSDRRAGVMTFHKQYGLVEERSFTPDMLLSEK